MPLQSTKNINDPIDSLKFLMGVARNLLGDEATPDAPLEARLSNLGTIQSSTRKAAIAGTVKSGKSTLANALLGRDALKRGAGIITSLVTRVRPSEKPGARITLKGWNEINREIDEAALFLGLQNVKSRDLRNHQDRDELALGLKEMGDDVLGDGGYFDKSVALINAFLEGFDQVKNLIEEEPKTIILDEASFEKHKDFAGADALAIYVDDMLLEFPCPKFASRYELADCQGYDSPNPRHMEKVQEYLAEAHLVVYVISSRVGIREADLRFLRYIKAVGLEESIKFVLNVDVGEHQSPADLLAIKKRVASDIGAVLPNPSIYVFSALRELLTTLKKSNAKLLRRDELLLEYWNEASDLDANQFMDFTQALEKELGSNFEAGLENARNLAVRKTADCLLSNIKAALSLADKEKQSLKTEEQDLRLARTQVEKSLTSFNSAMKGIADQIKGKTFKRIDAAFHPMGGRLSEELIGQIEFIGASTPNNAAPEAKKLLREMSRIFQEMRTALHAHKVETANPKAIKEIRNAWSEARREFAEAAAPPTEILTRSVEAYRKEALAMGIEIPRLENPNPDPATGRRAIPLLSAVNKKIKGRSDTEKLLAFARQWTKMLASGWIHRLTGKSENKGLTNSLLADAEKAVRKLLTEETRSDMLNYNEFVKHQVLGPSIDDLSKAWIESYSQTVKALTVDLDKLASRLDQEGSRREEIIPKLEGIIRDLDLLAA